MALIGAVSLPAQESVSLTVDATMDIYRAGGYNDNSSGGIAPVAFTFPAGGWRTMTFPTVGGVWGCQNGLREYGADGETSGACLSAAGPTNFGSIGPFSGYQATDFVGALVGIFLADTLPATPPAALRFYVSNRSDGGTQTDFLTLSPRIGQVFFIGDGLTGTGTIQTFVVPPAATHLYLGYVDTCLPPGNTVPGCYFDNVGSLDVTARLQYYIPDWVEPSLSTAPSARCCMPMTYDAAGYYSLLFGGGNAITGARYSDTWVWRYGWYQLSPAGSPSARMASGTAYDPSTGTVLLFGGEDSNRNPLGDTWLWDGVTWVQQFPAVSPPARDGNQSMAYDPITGTVVMFGGLSTAGGGYGGTPLGDTWEWNGRTKTWTQLFPATSPPPRRAPLAYDALTGTVVLFGGDNGAGDCCNIYYNDTWTWNGVTWTKQSPAVSPSPRTEHALAYDPSLGLVVMYGGYSTPSQGLDDTWAWTGATWRQLNLIGEPSGRWASAIDFDPLTNGLLLFGGEVTGDPYTNQTWLLVPVPLP
jgi:hypothetical protein